MPVTFVASCNLPTLFGEFAMHGFEDADTGQEHIALVLGDVANEEVVLCRVHSECLTGDCLFSMRCDCGAQLKHAMKQIAEKGCGVILYLPTNSRTKVPIRLRPTKNLALMQIFGTTLYVSQCSCICR